MRRKTIASGWFRVVVLLLPAGVVSAGAAFFQQTGNLFVMSNGNVRVEYNLSTGTADFFWKNARKISAFYSGVTLDTGYIKGLAYSNRTYEVLSSNQAAISATAAGFPLMKQFFVLDQEDSFLTRVAMEGTGLKSRWMGPVVVDTPGRVDLGAYSDNRALYVPFDNDHFARYNAMSINSTSTSYEASAFFDNVSRNGLVVGSVTHDTWKSGVFFSGSNNRLDKMNVFGGATSPSATWDVMPHGQVAGTNISSPTMFVGFGDDWRTVMESFADANAAQAAKLSWTNGVPFGWNSWGVIKSSINHAKAVAVSDFVRNNLQTNNFNNNGVAYINLDSYWDNLSDSELLDFASHCHGNGQKAGIYWAPFVWWGSATNATNSTVEGSSYKYSAVLLRDGNGNFEINDGALAMDPTHPGTRQRIDYFLNRFITRGFDYIKLDFLSHGALEGVHYDTNATTGIQAYNQGMQYVFNKLNGKMFISESIAPIFPYQYAHGRRIACDAFESISDTAYTMNAVTYGWWISGRLYQYSDPDQLVFAGADANENQSRLINGAITGTIFLNGDDLAGSAAAQNLARTCLTNPAINDVARAGRAFRAVEGNTGSQAADVFVRQDGTTWCLAAFNYSSSAVDKTIDLARAGISGHYSASDLWAGAASAATNSSLNVHLNAKQAKLFRLWTLPVLLSPNLRQNGAFTFTLQGDAGAAYALEKTTDFVAWNLAGILTNVTTRAQFVETNSSGSTHYYYRARLLH